MNNSPCERSDLRTVKIESERIISQLNKKKRDQGVLVTIECSS